LSAVPYFSTLSRKRHDFRGKRVVLIILIITEIDVTSKQYVLYFFFFSCTTFSQ
jgi:hypothetical protein